MASANTKLQRRPHTHRRGLSGRRKGAWLEAAGVCVGVFFIRRGLSQRPDENQSALENSVRRGLPPACWLRGRRELCDVVVVGGAGQHTEAHSCVLAAHSTVVAALLQGRLAARRDWSVLRPLVISVADSTPTTTTDKQPLIEQESQPGATNSLEVLVTLLYGEAVNVPPPLLPSLLHHAHTLGLSHHISTSLQASCGALNTATTTTSPRRKHSRKPVLKNALVTVPSDKMVDSCVVSVDEEQNQVQNEAQDEAQVGPGFCEGAMDVGETEGEVLEFSVVCDGVEREVNTPQPPPWPTEHCVTANTGTRNMHLEDSTDITANKEHSNIHLEHTTDTTDTTETRNIHLQDSTDITATSNIHLEDTTDTTEARNIHLEHSTDTTDITATRNIHLQDTTDITATSITHLQHTTDITAHKNIHLVDPTVNTETTNIHLHPDDTADMLGLVVSVSAGEPGQQEGQQKNKQKQRLMGGGRGLVCEVCGSSFQRCSDLIKHVQISQHYSLQCPLCFVQVVDVGGRALHFDQHDHQLPFFCAYCDLRFRTRAALTMHAPKHSTTKPFVCGDCGRGFKWRHALQAHSYTHSATTRLLCDVCGFSSKYVTTFKAHLLQHSGSFFPCPHPGCTFSTSRKTHLNDHYATHSKTRVHQCEVCGHSFSHAKNMRRHMRLHAPASQLLCSSVSKLQCAFQTTRLDKLRDHLTPVVVMDDGRTDDFSVLVVSPEIVELSEIAAHMENGTHGMETARNETTTQNGTEISDNVTFRTQNGTEISDNVSFPPDFLVDHGILLDKAEGGVSGIPPLATDLLGKIEMDSGSRISYQADSCGFLRSESVVLEVEEGMEVVEDVEERRREREKEESCIDAINIFDLMLDNVTS
ncbi:Zinc finger protein 567 [Chionoecetes opilio]|uniref:Zinc finger protein 567 n=1 Tax=Chionoecetes opilio TaxID=41210 RepID=A0A8J4YIT8_CHIOP|nr:Zinc finger protein 567 [Chionoecetes opilio]